MHMIFTLKWQFSPDVFLCRADRPSVDKITNIGGRVWNKINKQKSTKSQRISCVRQERGVCLGKVGIVSDI